MPIGHMQPNLMHQFEAYDGWSFALDDYLAENVTTFLNKPEFLLMGDQIDPMTYNDRYENMPIYAVASCGDEFFLPDSANFFWNDLKGEKHLRMVPDAEHSLTGHQIDVTLAIETFYHTIIHDLPRPVVTWTNWTSADGLVCNITLTVSGKLRPSHVKMWHARNEHKRDFRLVVCDQLNNPNCLNPIFWLKDEVEGIPLSDGSVAYSAIMHKPAQGWSAFFLEADFYYDDILPPLKLGNFKVSTDVQVVPMEMPYPPCTDNC